MVQENLADDNTGVGRIDKIVVNSGSWEFQKMAFFKTSTSGRCESTVTCGRWTVARDIPS